MTNTTLHVQFPTNNESISLDFLRITFTVCASVTRMSTRNLHHVFGWFSDLTTGHATGNEIAK